MLRDPVSQLADIAAAVANSTTIDLSHHVGGSIQLPSGHGTTEITVYSNLGEEWAVAQNEDGDDLLIVPTNTQVIRLRTDVFAFPQIRLVASGGDPTDDARVFLKS